ncbi:reverse transcriptase domain-containing protein [Tanacetum coccineum]
MVSSGGSRKQPYDRERTRLTEEIVVPAIPQKSLTDAPIILEGTIEGYHVRRIYGGGGSSSEIMYAHYFKSFDANVKSRLRKANAPLVRFSGKTYHPLGLIDLRVTMGEPRKSKTVLLEFAVVKCRLPYNVIMGRTEMRSFGATDRKNAEFMEGSTMKDSAWRMQVDYTSLNKVCAKDMYPLPEIEGELGSLMGYQYKCFLRLPREHNQVQVYLEEIVVKSRTEESLIEDVEETLDKLRWVNVKIDPSKCTFVMEEGNFLGYVVITEGMKVDQEKVKVILRGPTPKGPDGIRTLSLQLANISRFIPKMAELMLPIRNVRKSADAAETFDWTSEATKAFQKMKRRLAKLPTLTKQSPNAYFLHGIETCYTPTEKAVLTLVHTARSSRTTFRKHQVKVITDRPVEEMLKLSGTEGRLAKWAAELRTYHVSDIEGQVVKKFFGQGEQTLYVTE